MHLDLVNWFFKENYIDREDTPSRAAIEHFQIKLFLEKSPMLDAMDESFRKKLRDREEAIETERITIRDATCADQIVKLMRRGADIMNQQYLLIRALEFEDEIISIITPMLKTSLNDIFIELSARFLAVCEKDTSEDLITMYDDVRGAFTKSMLLVSLGFKAEEKRIPWFIKKFNELKAEYTNEDYCYGAFYALIEMEERFYGEKIEFSVPSNMLV